ncbi:CvpA family protein [Maricaulis sp. D1M11]|uniref:CvpA family protein n=1 Tax=Maricaulis sp. D1M11 TaxID=3076117 RepID=UPI0039B64422
MDGTLTAFDGIVIAVLLVSGLLALVRGFVREALSVTAFVAASLAALWSWPAFRGPAREIISPPWLADIAVFASVFILIYLAVTFITSSLSNGLAKGEDVNVVDRTAGFFFGVVRGLVLISIIAIFLTMSLPGGTPPAWMQEARFYPLVRSISNALQTLAPETSRMSETPPLPYPDDPIAETIRNDDTSYGRQDRNRLDDLIGSTADDQDDDG